MNEHPQRSGRSLLLLWCAGLIAQAMLMRIIAVAAVPGSGAMNRHGTLVFVAVAVAGHAWQAWLLFRPGWRFALWAALPLMNLVMPGYERWIEMQGIIAPCLEMVALASVRLRPWAWLLAGMGQVILGQIGGTLINNLGHSAASRGEIPSGLLINGVTGLWLLGEFAAAYVLAFWMSPLTLESRTAPPPPPGSTGA